MYINESLIFKENKSKINGRKNNELKLQKLKLGSLFLFFIIFIIILFKNYKKRKLKKFIKVKENVRPNNNDYCDNLDPIKLFNLRLENGPITICQNEKSKHICYQNSKGYYNNIFYFKNGVICKMENIILDPSKSRHTNIIYKGPVDKKNRGCPLLSKGFLNMKCKTKKNFKNYSYLYKSYFESWNYDYDNSEKLEELSPEKTIFFISRNQDSPNIFHGGSELINAISIMNLFNLNPETIQVIFLESMTLNNDPFYDLYKNIVSRGGEPIYIKNLKKKYHISSAFHIPINWDSGAFITKNFQNCKYSTKTYKLLNDLVNKYMKIPDFKDSFISDKEIYYYPNSGAEDKSNLIFNKSVTIQWRKIWPKGRKGQFRILANGKELADKLASFLPKNILIRLVDTASLSISEQISIMRKTDYLIGIHGAGLCLSVFMPSESILHEILPKKYNSLITLMSTLSGHVTYSDLIKYKKNNYGGNENLFFEPDDFVKNVLNHMLQNNFF